MSFKLQDFLQNTKRIRKLQKRSIHDCASFLNLSRESYLKFEQGQYSLTLPEVELLAQFFNVPVSALFQSNFDESVHFPLLDEDIHSDYSKIRTKMIGVTLNNELANREIELKSLHEMTQIPQEELNAYINDMKPVPLDHLLLIQEALSLSDEIIFGLTTAKDNQKNASLPEDWLPEYPEKFESTLSESDRNFNPLIEALKKIHGNDQAEIAKLILQKLKQT